MLKTHSSGDFSGSSSGNSAGFSAAATSTGVILTRSDRRQSFGMRDQRDVVEVWTLYYSDYFADNTVLAHTGQSHLFCEHTSGPVSIVCSVFGLNESFIDSLIQPRKMLSQESQKMRFECSVAIKCEILKNFKIQTFKIYNFKSKFKLLNVLTDQH